MDSPALTHSRASGSQPGSNGASLNLGRWSQLESAIRQLATQSNSTLTVITGPIFDPSAEPQTVGPNRVVFPTHFFKVVLATNQPGNRRTAHAFILPNSTHHRLAPLHTYATTIREVELRTGLDFFSFLPDPVEQQLETMRIPLLDQPNFANPNNSASLKTTEFGSLSRLARVNSREVPNVESAI